jgi:CspA family cold shock protein
MSDQQTADRQRGVVKWFSDPKGYGFILREQEPDIFVHHTAIQMDGFRTLKEGQAVIYDLLTSPKGLQAANVVPVLENPPAQAGNGHAS